MNTVKEFLLAEEKYCKVLPMKCYNNKLQIYMKYIRHSMIEIIVIICLVTSSHCVSNGMKMIFLHVCQYVIKYSKKKSKIHNQI